MTSNPWIISSAGVRSPRILYGTAWKAEQTAALVAQAIEHGFRGIDTACQPKHYNESGVGSGVAASLDDRLTRADLYLQTKFTPSAGHDPKKIPYDPTARISVQVEQSFMASLRNLRTDYVDCLVLHSPLKDSAQTQQAWQAMEVLFDSGGARQLGISNCYQLDAFEDLFRAARVKPAVIQNRFHPETNYDRGIRAFCRQHGILYQSFWTLSANQHVLANDMLTNLAQEYGRTPAQILFRYLTQTDVVPLTGTRSEAHMREDLEIFDFELTITERAALDALF